jgi:nicotinamidase-related amidase
MKSGVTVRSRRGGSMEKYFLSRHEPVLVIIDIQERLADAVQRKESVINNCRVLIESAKLFNIPVVVTEQYPKGLGRTVDQLKSILPDHCVIEKTAFDCCAESKFEDELNRLARKTIILAGMETHICVLQTCVALLNRGYYVNVIGDAVASRTHDNWKLGLDYMRDAGAVITGTETVAFQLLKAAGSDEFKVISRLIK